MNDEPPEPRPRVIVGTREAGVVGEGVLENGGADRWVALAEHVLNDAGLGRTPIELTVHFVDEPEMAELNRDHLGGDGPTDVLAFPVDDPSEVPEGLPVLLGDVVICPAVATRQATGGGLEAELSLLLVHGILHLLGHDHAEPDERSAMQETERRVLDGFSRA